MNIVLLKTKEEMRAYVAAILPTDVHHNTRKKVYIVSQSILENNIHCFQMFDAVLDEYHLNALLFGKYFVLFHESLTEEMSGRTKNATLISSKISRFSQTNIVTKQSAGSEITSLLAA